MDTPTHSSHCPISNWCRGEISFSDFYIIPRVKKLKECSAFDLSSDNYLNYAIKNRNQWEQRGEAAVAEMLQRIRDGHADDHLESVEEALPEGTIILLS